MKKFLISFILCVAFTFCIPFAACGLLPGTGGNETPPDGPVTKKTAQLTFIALNDLHGKYEDTAAQPGVDELTTYIKTLYADNAREEILLSSGDMWQGTVESSTNRGALMTDWMNHLGFASMTLGNHEFDWGVTAIQSNAQRASFPILGINVKYNGKAAEFCKSSVIVEKGGAKIGIIGAIGDCLSSISGEFQTGLEFAKGDELTELVKAEAKKLKGEGCNFIVYSLHDGYEKNSNSVVSLSQSDMSAYYDIALSNGYVDLVFEGHTHKAYVGKDKYGVYHLQGGGENKYISTVDVTLEVDTGKYKVTANNVSNTVYAASNIAGDDSVQDIFDKYFAGNNPYTTVLGTNARKRSDSEVEQAVADLYFKKGTEVWGSDYEIVLGGGFIKTRSPYNLSAGNVTYADIFSLMPFDNAIVLGAIKGSDLLDKFINTKNSDYYISPKVDASAIDKNKTYYIIVDTYTSTYKPNKITEVARLDTGVYARDLLAQFIKDGGFA